MMTRNLVPVLLLTLCSNPGVASDHEAWLSHVLEFRVVCSSQTLDSQDFGPAPWVALQESLPGEATADLGALLALPDMSPTSEGAAPLPGDGPAADLSTTSPEAASAGEPVMERPASVPCAQYFGDEHSLPKGMTLRKIPASPALFVYCRGFSAAPCQAILEELLRAGGADSDPLVWSRSVLGWLDDEGRPYFEPGAEELEAKVVVRESVRQLPDSEAVLGPLGLVVVAHLTEDEVPKIARVLDAPRADGVE